ncbi:MAG: recombinase family protein [Firmicutes bacterium]|nr:recombinase family protein [Bacillota bacterium]
MNISNNIWSQKIVVSPYCRVSTDKDDQANSLDSQIRYFGNFIKNHPNWTLGEIYYDEGISGTSVKKRKNFNRLIDDALAGRVQFIITKEVSRFARNTVDTLVFTRQLKAIGVGVYFVLDNINTLDSDGELRLTIMASLAQEESRKTSERVKWGIKRRMETGIVFGLDLFGYEVNEGKLFIKPQEAKIVHELFARYLEGEGSYTLGNFLRRSCAELSLPRAWTSTTVMRTLKNEKYVGDLVQRKTTIVDYLTKQVAYTNDEDRIYFYDNHDAIIDRDTWNKVQSEIKRRSTKEQSKTRHSNKYWGSGKIRCGECNHGYGMIKKRYPSGKITFLWRCCEYTDGRRNKNSYGKKLGCDSGGVNDKILQTCVKEAIKYVKVNNDILISEITEELRQVQVASKPINVAPLLAKIEELKSLKKDTVDLCLRKLISEADLTAQNKHYDDQIESLEKQVFETEQDRLVAKSQMFNSQKFIVAVQDILNMEDDNTEFLKNILTKVVIYKDKTLIVYLHHLPFGIKIKYSSKGREQFYTVIIDNIELVYDTGDFLLTGST